MNAKGRCGPAGPHPPPIAPASPCRGGRSPAAGPPRANLWPNTMQNLTQKAWNGDIQTVIK